MANQPTELTPAQWQELAELFTACGRCRNVREAVEILTESYYIARFEQTEHGRGLYSGEFFVVQEVLFADPNGTVSPPPFLIIRNNQGALVMLNEDGLPGQPRLAPRITRQDEVSPETKKAPTRA